MFSFMFYFDTKRTELFLNSIFYISVAKNGSPERFQSRKNAITFYIVSNFVRL